MHVEESSGMWKGHGDYERLLSLAARRMGLLDFMKQRQF